MSAPRAAPERASRGGGAQMRRLGPVATAPGSYALGMAYLALGREETAREHLLAAWSLGEQTPAVAAGLGRAFGALYESALLDLQRPGGAADPTGVEQARAELLQPALKFLRQANAHSKDPYLDALLAFYEQRWGDAIRLARVAQGREATHREAVQLEAEAAAAQADVAALSGDIATARAGFELGRDLYSGLLARVPSDAGLCTGGCLLGPRRARRIAGAAIPDPEWLSQGTAVSVHARASGPAAPSMMRTV